MKMMSYFPSTECSPNLMMFGNENSFSIDLMVGLPPDQRNEMYEIQYVIWLRRITETVFQSRFFCKETKCDYDTHLKRRGISQGEWVWRWYPLGANKKLGLGWIGPYLVVEDISQFARLREIQHLFLLLIKFT